MRYDLHHVVPGSRPLIADVEPADASRPGAEDRDEAILELLREKLKGRQGNSPDTSGIRGHAAEGEDKYEPQRLGRKICWQYDSTARKVPLLRRHYI
ncbi:MAG TPA: hypothetical protein VK465_19085 [Fibrobacteria bacterium]|nr:hypothetical protein [Fibrobacteria bacterium]